jgi:hypothetical protein
MYDALTGRFTFPCPARGETRVTLSDFRQLERLPGAAHPAVFQVLFACTCGEEHEGLVTHDDLDWAPLGLRGGVFYNLMTARLDLVDSELSDLAARRIQAGDPTSTSTCRSTTTRRWGSWSTSSATTSSGRWTSFGPSCTPPRSTPGV